MLNSHGSGHRVGAVDSAPGADTARPWTEAEFVAELRAVGTARYHHRHPFHLSMNRGALTADQVRGWIANRFHYQLLIPRKDAAILANCTDREIRRSWLRRIVDHDGKPGTEGQDGGIEAWLGLGLAAGLTRAELLDERHVLPGVRFAADAYLEFVRRAPWPIAIASSLTELFAPDLMSERLAAFERHYTFVKPAGLAYFRSRLTLAPADATEALAIVLTHCRSAATQAEAVHALELKCALLWAMLDAMDYAYGGGAARGG